MQDAEKIKHNEPLSDYEKYQCIEKLHELLACIPIFESEELKHHKYSLIDLARYYHEHRKFPKLILIPSCLQYFAEHYENYHIEKNKQEMYSFNINKFPEIDWVPSHFTNAEYWQALSAISCFAARTFGFDLEFGFSTNQSGDLLHTNTDSRIIYWNVYAISKQDNRIMQFMKELDNKQVSIKSLNYLLDCVSHEIVHAQLEEACSSTHNRSFSIKQRNLLVGLSLTLNSEQLINKIQDIYQKYVKTKFDQNRLDAKAFIQSQFLETRMHWTVFALFHNRDDKAKDQSAALSRTSSP